MRADKNVDAAGRDALDDVFLLLCGAETRDHFDVDGELGEALLEGFEMLEAEYSCRCEDGDLFAILHSFEGGAHGHFGFAVADVAAEEAIHGPGRFHIFFDSAYRGDLV